MVVLLLLLFLFSLLSVLTHQLQRFLSGGAASQVMKSLLAAAPPGRDGEVNTSVTAQIKQPLISDYKNWILPEANSKKNK